MCGILSGACFLSWLTPVKSQRYISLLSPLSSQWFASFDVILLFCRFCTRGIVQHERSEVNNSVSLRADCQLSYLSGFSSRSKLDWDPFFLIWSRANVSSVGFNLLQCSSQSARILHVSIIPSVFSCGVARQAFMNSPRAKFLFTTWNDCHGANKSHVCPVTESKNIQQVIVNCGSITCLCVSTLLAILDMLYPYYCSNIWGVACKTSQKMYFVFKPAVLLRSFCRLYFQFPKHIRPHF